MNRVPAIGSPLLEGYIYDKEIDGDWKVRKKQEKR